MLQEREFEPLGSNARERVDVRVIAATNRDLRQMVAEGKFQEDLYYRLNVIPIEMPPLRERREDIPLLVEHFIRKHAQRTGKRIDGIRTACRGAAQYDWPGNVRELENTIERAVVLSRTADHRCANVVDDRRRRRRQPRRCPRSTAPEHRVDGARDRSVARSTRAGGIKKDAAEIMGISQRALSYYLGKYRID